MHGAGTTPSRLFCIGESLYKKFIERITATAIAVIGSVRAREKPPKVLPFFYRAVIGGLLKVATSQ